MVPYNNSPDHFISGPPGPVMIMTRSPSVTVAPAAIDMLIKILVFVESGMECVKLTCRKQGCYECYSPSLFLEMAGCNNLATKVS